MKYGGKADSLLFLVNNGILVPSFFIITKEDYIKFLIDNNIYKRIEELFANKKYDDIKNLLMKQPITKELSKKIAIELPKLNGKLYAVRSSANNEDGKEKSFAGQYDSF